MKPFLFLIAFFTCLNCYSQKLEIEISTPQPRLGETFSLVIKIDTAATNFFDFLSDKFQISNYADQEGTGSILAVHLQAKKLGRNELGPMELKINNRIYKTDKIIFDVVDSLPAVNKGLWMRTMHVDDSTSYIIIEQRIPALTYITHDSPNSISSTTKTNGEDKEIEMIQDPDKIDFRGSHSEYQSIKTTTGTEQKFEYFFALYTIKRSKNSSPVIITRGDFKNMPEYYSFKNITVN